MGLFRDIFGNQDEEKWVRNTIDEDKKSRDEEAEAYKKIKKDNDNDTKLKEYMSDDYKKMIYGGNKFGISRYTAWNGPFESIVFYDSDALIIKKGKFPFTDANIHMNGRKIITALRRTRLIKECILCEKSRSLCMCSDIFMKDWNVQIETPIFYQVKNKGVDYKRLLVERLVKFWDGFTGEEPEEEPKKLEKNGELEARKEEKEEEFITYNPNEKVRNVV